MKYNFIIIILAILITQNPLLTYDGLLFKPLTANIFEPRIGSLYQFSKEKLRLDIGASLDLLEIINNDSTKIRIGADFFTFTRLRSEGKLKFPVETSDYFFGINTSLRNIFMNYEFFTRIRISHISSHLVDGMSIDGRFDLKPFVYSREFIEIAIATYIKAIRYYLGFNYTFSTIPKDIKIFTPQIGADYIYSIYEFLDFITGFDFKLFDTGKGYEITYSLQAGFKINTSKKTGILLSYYQYSGKSIHGIFYKEYDNYNGIGFQIYFY